MDMFFRFNSRVSDLLFKGWTTQAVKYFAPTCLCFVVAAFVLEAIKLLQTFLQKRVTANILTYAKTEQNLSERSPLVGPLLLPSSIQRIKYRRIKYHVGKTITHVFHMILGYLVMLAVMSYNGWLLVAVAIGSGLGYFIFGTYTNTLMQPPSAQNYQSQASRRSHLGTEDTHFEQVYHHDNAGENNSVQDAVE